jgi:hypothetical protein
MAESKTTTFRLPVEFHDLLGRMSQQLGTSNTRVLERSVLLTAGLLNEASRSSYADLETIREREGEDARIVMAAFEEDGKPVGRLLINGKDPDYARARPFVDEEGGRAFMFLDVLRQHPNGGANFIEIGDEALFVPAARFPVGTLPWPPKPHLAIQIELKDLEQVAQETAQAAEDLIKIPAGI